MLILCAVMDICGELPVLRDGAAAMQGGRRQRILLDANANLPAAQQARYNQGAYTLAANRHKLDICKRVAPA
jgi:hypothetical protein